MKVKLGFSLAVVLVATGGLTWAQTPAPAKVVTMVSGLQAKYTEIKGKVQETAEKMPEADFFFRPTPEIRTFAELFGHIANSQFTNCSTAKGEANPSQGVDNEKIATRAELMAALNKSFAYCDSAYASLTDQTAAQIVKQGENEMMRGYALMNNVWHDTEIYGSAATYLRLKGLMTRPGEDDLSRHR